MEIKRYKGHEVVSETGFDDEWVRYSDLAQLQAEKTSIIETLSHDLNLMTLRANKAEADLKAAREELAGAEARLELVFHYYSEFRPGWVEYGKWKERLDKDRRIRALKGES